MITLVSCAFSEKQWIEDAEETHGLKSWWSVKALEANVTIKNKKGVLSPDSGYFYFEAHGPRVLYKEKGKTLVFDGKTAWGWPKELVTPKDRFHLLTWTWFIMQPFKMQGEGSRLSDYKSLSINSFTYNTALQSFDTGVGDTPDDWYRLLIDPQTNLLSGVGYIVTYFKAKSEAEKSPSILFYKDYQSFKGIKLSTRYELWHWDGKNALKGDKPKAEGKVEILNVFDSIDSLKFSIPKEAVEIHLPNMQ